MNVNPILIKMKDSVGIPVSPDKYEGTSPAYITFNYADEREGDFADNDNQTETVWMQIHLFTPVKNEYSNYLSYKELIRKYLKSNSFFNISIQTFLETDTNLRHTVIECQKTEQKEG